jgi:NAD(P)-dependent dehydrogenase (short-subunit alcohol dehydrogenase family)
VLKKVVKAAKPLIAEIKERERMQDWTRILSRDLYDEFHGRGVIVAGGASGIGARIADGLHWLGAKVAIVDKSEAAARALAQRLSERGDGYAAPCVVAADLAAEADRRAALQDACARVGDPAFFVSTLGYDPRFSFEDVSQEQLELLLRVNFIAPVLAARDLLPALRRAGGGAICLFTSRHASQMFDPELLGYGAAKAALDGGVKRLARHAGEGNTPENIIRVFGFCPGWVQTERQKERFDDGRFAHAAQEQLVPVGMMPEDLVAPVIFNLSRHARLLSGSTVFYDGGEDQNPHGAASS